MLLFKYPDLIENLSHRRKSDMLRIPDNLVQRKMWIVVVGCLFPIGGVEHGK